MKDQQLKYALEGLCGWAVLGLTHGACVADGFYKGLMNARGIEISVPVPLKVLWPINFTGTIAGKLLVSAEDYNSGARSRAADIALIGIPVGAVAAPVEFAAGYGLGYLAHYGELLAHRIFN